MASKPGTCVKVLTIEPPPADPRLREDMALLADCALPPELRVLKGMLVWWAGRVSRNRAGSPPRPAWEAASLSQIAFL